MRHAGVKVIMEEDYSDMPALIEIYLFVNNDNFWEPVRIGLNRKQMKTCNEVLEQRDCSICLETVKVNKQVVCCQNTFCKKCFIKWFKVSVKCPLCNRDIRDFIDK